MQPRKLGGRLAGVRSPLLGIASAVMLATLAGCAAPGHARSGLPAPGHARSGLPAAAHASASAQVSPDADPVPSSAASSTVPTSAPSIDAVDETGAVPWVDEPGTMFSGSPLPQPPVPTAGPPCRASDLQMVSKGRNGAGGSLYWYFTFRNAGSTACILRGFPKVVASEPSKPPVVATDAAMFGDEQAATTAPGESADLIMRTDFNCPARFATPTAHPALIYHTLTVSIPGGGQLTQNVSLDLECGLYTGEFWVPQPTPTYTKSPVDGAKVAIELPSAVDAGTTLHYVVAVTNPTTHDMALAPCPGYQQGLGASGKAALALNCVATPVIRAGQTVRFAMRLPVPADTPTGLTDVYWDFAGIPDKTGAAHGTVLVRGADTPCLAGQLGAAITGPGFEPANNMLAEKHLASAVTLRLANRSSSACSVRGAPKVDVKGADGATLGLSWTDNREYRMPSTYEPDSVVVLAPGESATTTLYWYLDWCGPDPNPVSVTITLAANGAALTATPSGGWAPPACQNQPGSAGGRGEVSSDPLRPASS